MAAETETGQYVTAAQREQWARDGFLKFDPGCSLELVDRALEDLEHRYLWEGEIRNENGVVYSPGRAPRIRDAWKLSDAVRSIALLPKVIGTLTELYGREPLPFQTLNFPVPTQQRTHSDAMHFNSDPPGEMCGVWVAFEDVDMDNGPLVYYPGSHRLPFTRYEDVGFEARSDAYPNYREFIRDRNQHYEAYVASVIEERGLEPEFGTMRKGEALIWSANLLHGGSPQRDRNRTRHSQVTHYLFNAAGYFTEMESEGDRRNWKQPDWIV
jgi:ectoine hydroxylase-related dioxygenase (phytanoyl-CoA dioxygenase family)